MRINDNFEKLPESYLFSTVASKLREYRESHPGVDVIRMDIGDVTLPIPQASIKAMHRAVDDMAEKTSFHGYGPEQGYDFLRNAIAVNAYAQRGIEITTDEIFISDGAKSDLGNLGDIYAEGSVVAVANPGYPVYVDSNVIDGRGGTLVDGKWSNFVYLECNEENGFKPVPPAEHADVIFLCSPANPTGVTFTKAELKAWVNYALANNAVIIYDSAYCAYITDPELPHSIYEVEGARECAIEVRSFSKTAGFTGLRCGYTVVPASVCGFDEAGNKVSLRKLWLRRQTTKFNGASYVIQRGAEALYTSDGKIQVRENVGYYLENARLIRETMSKAGFTVFGGDNSPYIWVKSPDGESSWDLFDKLLHEVNISCTPGVGFGSAGEGYIRLTGFNSKSNTEEAMRRIIGFFADKA
ncbi:MAG: LL-diaminopimelate aminotransferase [Muribaculaceae bacterium]|nr:LL-diaminopimelate aminotransferase [Muribaculaceae bacterium]